MDLTVTERDAIIALALREDLGAGDVTSTATIPAGARATAVILVKAAGVMAGGDVARAVFHAVDRDIHVELLVADGMPIGAAEDLITLEGPAEAVLAAERTVLNLLGRMCGVATATRAYVDAVAGTGARILDTRKTMPGMRALDKHAVACGGGVNHRMGLFDAFLIKDNHLRLAGGVAPAVAAARATRPELAITVEVEDLDQLREALHAAADRVLLDNMPTDLMRQAVTIVAGRADVEASGGITLANVREVALTGVDVISVGAITHSAAWLDVSMEVS